MANALLKPRELARRLRLDPEGALRANIALAWRVLPVWASVAKGKNRKEGEKALLRIIETAEDYALDVHSEERRSHLAQLFEPESAAARSVEGHDLRGEKAAQVIELLTAHGDPAEDPAASEVYLPFSAQILTPEDALKATRDAVAPWSLGLDDPIKSRRSGVEPKSLSLSAEEIVNLVRAGACSRQRVEIAALVGYEPAQRATTLL